MNLAEIAGRLMRCPAAPYHESLVASEVLKICAEADLRTTRDRFGNILVALDTARSARTAPFVLAAHLDHPAFVARSPGKFEFLGGVGDSYFQAGVPLRLYPGGRKARLGKRLSKDQRLFSIVAEDKSGPRLAFAVWDLPDFELTSERIVGRACDDLVGVATVLHVLIELKQMAARVNVIGALSRAEEVGFHGALALAGHRRLPKESLVISLETSREMPPAQMGAGVIVRVGDRASIFDSAGTRFLAEVAQELVRDHSGFKFQRALMSGGACEATAYQEFGYRTAAVCVALGNYHNCAPGDRIDAEFVSRTDAEGMSLLLQHSARRMKDYRELTGRLPKRLRTYRSEAITALRKHELTLLDSTE